MAANAPETEPAWPTAVQAVSRWLEHGERLDTLLETGLHGLAGAERGRAQQLVLSVARHLGRIEAALRRLVPRQPRPLARAVLITTGAELLVAGAGEGRPAKIVHHAVGQAKLLLSPPEVKLVNAVARKLAGVLAAQTEPAAGAAEWAEFFSHPVWLVERWRGQFGDDATRALLAWDQTPGVIHARWRAAEAPPEWLQPAGWPGFFEAPAGRWPDLELLLGAEKIYLQDPSTRHAVGLLAPQPGETVLDVCAAPGGKSLLMADAMQRGQVVAVDLPGARLARLRENLARAPARSEDGAGGRRCAAGERGFFSRAGLAGKVFRRAARCAVLELGRDAAPRRCEMAAATGDFARHARQQLELLVAVAQLAAPGGRLVYSTCSLDAEENERVVAAFLTGASDEFTLETQVRSRPPESRCDGAGAFLLRKK